LPLWENNVRFNYNKLERKNVMYGLIQQRIWNHKQDRDLMFVYNNSDQDKVKAMKAIKEQEQLLEDEGEKYYKTTYQIVELDS